MREAISLKTRFDVLKRDRFTCQYCGARPPKVEIRVDHINPVAKGGSSKLENLITACFECNAGKRDDEVTEFALCRRVWLRVRDLPHYAGYDDEMRERVAFELTRMFVGGGYGEAFEELSNKPHKSWEDWRAEAQLFYRDYLAHCVDLHLGTNGYGLLSEYATPTELLS